ncbi:hypothetical protein PR048_017097 [Dryococelus australis]|uniref:Uncharacterized protein n=1 Tax=Dryococelus australis TaxID=614101 RepID=A0ABQ9H8M0_9NEOP|nr:hypothetical protein PR048_017097 [Dryococelus australis]
MQGRGKWDIPEKKKHAGVIPTCENSKAAPQGIEPGLFRCKASDLAATPPWHRVLQNPHWGCGGAMARPLACHQSQIVITTGVGAVARALASHHGDPGSIPSRFTPESSHVRILLDDAACQRVFSGYSCFPRPCIPAPLHPRVSFHVMSGEIPSLGDDCLVLGSFPTRCFAVALLLSRPGEFRSTSPGNLHRSSVNLKEVIWDYVCALWCGISVRPLLTPNSLHYECRYITEMDAKALHRNSADVILLTGSTQGETVCVPRIPLIPNDFTFQFKSLQFPLAVCFAMMINKSQGQTLKLVGVDLRQDFFCHCQVYVTRSRTNPARLLAGSLLDFRKWESCRTMPLVGGFSMLSPVSPSQHSDAAPYSPKKYRILKSFSYKILETTCNQLAPCKQFYAHDIGNQVIATHRRAETVAYRLDGQMLFHEVVQPYGIDVIERQ